MYVKIHVRIINIDNNLEKKDESNLKRTVSIR